MSVEQNTEYKKRQELMTKASELGISFRNNASIESLETLIKEKLEEMGINPEQVSMTKMENAEVVAAPLHKYRSANAIREKQVKEAQRLIRVNITCMNPLKAAWQGEIFTFGNDLLTLKRMVPFNTDTHVESAILAMIKNRKYRVANKPKKGRNANDITPILVPEFAVKELKPLSRKELNDLAAQQAAAKGN